MAGDGFHYLSQIGLTILWIRPRPAPVTLHTQLNRRPLLTIAVMWFIWPLTPGPWGLMMATGNPSLPVIRAVLLAQTQTHLMGPSDYNRESAPELESAPTVMSSHKTQMLSESRYLISLFTKYFSFIRDTITGWTHHQVSGLVYSRGQHLCEPCHHWGDLTTLDSHVLVVV